MIEQMLKDLIEQPNWNDRDINNFAQFLKVKKNDAKFYSVSDWATGDTYVIIKWPHKVPGLTVLP